MEQYLLSSLKRAHTRWFKMCDVVSKALLKKRLAAIARSDETKSDAIAKANRDYNDKLSSAISANDAVLNSAKRVHDEGMAIALQHYAEGVKAPDAIYRTTCAVAKEIYESRQKQCQTLCQQEKGLARINCDLELKDFRTDEDREQVRLAFEAILKAADEKCKNDCRLAELAYKSAEYAAGDEFRRVTKPMADALAKAREDLGEHLGSVRYCALQKYTATMDRASKERDKSQMDASAAHRRQLALIQAEFSAGRKLQLTALSAE
jgi:hypothetical protein